MADWTELDVNSLLPGEPMTSAKALAFFENPVALAEGASSAPVVATGWHPHNLTNVGGAQTGLFYDHAVNGNQSQINTPDFEDGYEYAIRMENFGATGAATITVAAFRSVTGSFSPEVNLIEAGNSLLWGVLEVPFARTEKTGQGVFSATGLYRNTGNNTDFIGALGIPYGVSTAQKTTRIRFAGTTFNSGRLYLLRRREYVSG